MSAKSIYENQGKSLIFRTIKNSNLYRQNSLVIQQNDDIIDSISEKHDFLKEKIVCKPDQLIKRRGKLGLIKIGYWEDIKNWINDRMNTDFQIGNCNGKLNRFLIEPFIAHETADEHYLCIYSERQCDVILFYHLGGIDIGNVDEKATKIEIPIDNNQLTADMISQLLVHLESTKQLVVSEFIENLYEVYKSQYFTYLEINPFVVKKKNDGDDYEIILMDLAAKIDQTAEFQCKNSWKDLEFPAGFGRDAYPEESKIQELDSKSGASLKLTVINPKGRIWTMVAGGGASVIFADTICDYGKKDELANYGEYSGAPSEQQTYEYAKTILSLMTKYEHKEGKVLLIGGGIANFTNVAATFKGIVKALKEFQVLLKEHNVSIFVRRAGPNYQEGLRIMRELGEFLGVPMHVFGPETHMTSIVAMALHKRDIPDVHAHGLVTTANFLLINKFDSESKLIKLDKNRIFNESGPVEFVPGLFKFTKTTKAIVWGMQNRAVQSMLDFDFVCSRTVPSVAAIVYPMIDDHRQKFYFGHKEILIPVYKKMSKCIANHPDVSVLINFASLRSAYDSTVEVLNDFPQIRCISIIAEGIPENLTRKIILLAKLKKVVIIGPATVGGIKPGCFKIGNTGGMMDNIIASKLYRPGSVAYVSKSGGMSNELNNIIALNTDGVNEGVAIGGDRYPGSVFIDFIMNYEHDENVKIIVILGEVGGKDEYDVIKAIKSKMITKPVIAWCIGTCAHYFTTNVQFGHAGSCANAAEETAMVKNAAFKEAGAVVPDSFDDLGTKLREVYLQLVASGDIIEKPEVPPPTVPMDYSWARELGIIRKPASFMTSICDERGSELLYAGVPISNIIEQDFGIGGVLGLLWFQRRLPAYCSKFIEMCLMVTADHGPAVSGAHNTIVCARAGKDLISSLTSGLLTIGDRFGGALDAAAKQFSAAYDSNQSPMDFVNQTRKDGKLIMGIGHRVKSINNPDQRVAILKKYVQQHFPKTHLLNYALEVEKITTSKKPNLILNVDGFIGVTMVDLLRNCGAFSIEEANEFIEIGSLNALFVLGRSIGFIGHYLDQNRLKQGLYRHPWDDISYVLPEQNDF